MNVSATIATLTRELAAQGTPARAAGAQRYLKSALRFLGAPVPAIRRAARDFTRAEPGLDRKTLKALCAGLWVTRVHELRSLGIAILERRVDLLTAADAGWLIAFVADADTWAHVDWLAIKVIGALVAREPALAARLDTWARHESFWVRRTALLALHDPLAAGGGDFAHFERLAVPLLAEREFFIRKAIGWVLRATTKRTPERTIAFVRRHAAAMSGLTFREATRNLPPARRKELTALRERSD